MLKCSDFKNLFLVITVAIKMKGNGFFKKMKTQTQKKKKLIKNHKILLMMWSTEEFKEMMENKTKSMSRW